MADRTGLQDQGGATTVLSGFSVLVSVHGDTEDPKQKDCGALYVVI